MKNQLIRAFVLLACTPFLIQCATQKEARNLDYRIRHINSRLIKIDQGMVNLNEQAARSADKNSLANVQKQMAGLNSSIEGLQKDFLQIKGFLDELNRTSQILDSKNVRLKTELAGTLGDISGKMNMLTSQLEQTSSSIEAIKAARLREETERAIRQAKEAERAAEKAKAKEMEALRGSQLKKIEPSATKKKIKGGSVSAASKTTKTKLPVDRVIGQGLARFKAKDYKGAHGYFSKYLAENSKGVYAAEARFYLGECLFKRKEFEMAILEYQRVIDEYRKTPQAVAALLMQGTAFEKLKDTGTAKMVYYKLLDEFPKTKEAAKAKKRLEILN